MTFQSAHPALARALAARGYETPTAVQLAVLDPDKAGRDLLVSAQTGSGKTVAFGLAIAPTLLGEAERLPAAAEPLALIIAPTRELALQVQRELEWLYNDTGARVVTCVGGMDVRGEARQLERGAHIVVGTPGRLRDHLERRRLDLQKLAAVVLDEADEMLDLGFREDLEYILDKTPETRQTLLFSATMPREIETLAGSYQRDAARIETLRRNEQHADIEYRAMRVAPHDIEHAVVNVLRLHEARATLVFCATRESVKRMHIGLTERGFSAVALSGELTQSERTHALQALRDGRARVLVATDVAARGLDLPDLALVIHAELPNDAETLLHRSGRTGRAGNKGLATLIVPYNRRRKAEALIGAAKLKVTWVPAPTADEIRARDQERFLDNAIFTDPATEDDEKLAQVLKAGRTADEIALALVRYHRAQLPAPEDLAEDTGPPPRRDERGRPQRECTPHRPERTPHQSDRKFSPPAADNARSGDEHRRAHPVRDQGRDMVWFRVDIGRERNADPRWLLPLLCRAGDVTKAEVGAIKIFDRDTRFQIAAEHADKFAEAALSMKPNEGRISRVGANMHDARGEPTPPREDASPRWEKKGRSYAGQSYKGQGYKGKSDESKSYKAKNFEPRTSEARAPEAQSSEAKPFAAKVAEGYGAPSEGRPSEQRPKQFDRRDKKPWHDRKKGKPGASFDAKADEPRRHRKGPRPQGPHGAASNSEGGHKSDPKRPHNGFKHAHKKKHRGDRKVETR
jgi:ATP-dependent RNA helicase DeaD